MSVELWQHDTDGQTEVLGEKLVPFPVCELQILHGTGLEIDSWLLW